MCEALESIFVQKRKKADAKKFFNMMGTDVEKMDEREFKLFSHGHFENI